MTSKKKCLGNNLSSLLEMPTIPISLEKLVGKTESVKEPSVVSPFTLSSNTSLDTLAHDLGALKLEESMDSFINKYGSSHYESLDELLAASIQNSQFVNNYMAPPQKDSTNLFEGLGDLLEI